MTKHLVKHGRVVFKLCQRTDRQTSLLVTVAICNVHADSSPSCEHWPVYV